MTGRQWVGLAIVAGWVGVIGWHVRREYFKGERVRLEEGARSLAPGALFYTIRMDDRAIGVATSRLDTVDGGFTFDDVTRLDVPAGGSMQRAIASTHVELSSALAVRRLEFDLDSELGRFGVKGEVVGDSVLRLTVGAGGKDEVNEVRLDGPLVVPAALPLRLAAAGRLEVGREFRAKLFDPSVLATREIRLRVLGRDTLVVPDSAAIIDGEWRAAAYDTVPTWRISESVGTVETLSWIDDDGRMIRSQSPLGFTMERTEYELASAAWTSAAAAPPEAGYGALIESTAIASDAPIGDVEAADSLAVVLGGVDLAGFDLEGGRQTLRGDTLRVRREPPSALRATYSLPYRGGGPAADELGATPLIQSRDPRIQRQARAIAGGETDPAVVARRLTDWVYGALDKKITLSVPSAVQVLEARRGDCNEHTVLYVALARSLGLPARTAVGLVSVRGRFYYHAWPEVWLGADWVAVDPTLGQYPADASHLRFLTGDLVRQLELVRLIGRLRVEKV